MGMATANTIVAIESGASGADVTIGGIGDRSGNACLEEVALVAEYRLGRKTGVELSRLTESTQAILETFGLLDRRLRPVVGDFTFVHSTPSHFNRVKFEGMLFINEVCESFFTEEDRAILDRAGSSEAYGSYLPYAESVMQKGKHQCV